MTYRADAARYDVMDYRQCGRSGLRLPAISLGLWQNFGAGDDQHSALDILRYAFDTGITHFDLANNYGPPPGAAEELMGRLLARDFRPYRDEIVIATQAGWRMGPGPYGDGGSRKYLIASCDQSLKRLGLDYVDIFYHHRYDHATPLEESMGALADLHRQGKALYVGISSYPEGDTRKAHAVLRQMGVPLLVHQPSYSILNRWIEDDGTIEACGELGVGVVAFSPLAQGVLSGKYAQGSKGGRAAGPASTIRPRALARAVLQAVEALGAVARARGQTPVQLALSWVLRRPEVTSALIGVRTREQLKDCLGAVGAAPLGADELREIDAAAAGGMLNSPPNW